MAVDENGRTLTFAELPRPGRCGWRPGCASGSASARATSSRGSCRPGSSRWCSSARCAGSVRCRTRCCRSTATARCGSSSARRGAVLLVVPSEWQGFDFGAHGRRDRRGRSRSADAGVRPKLDAGDRSALPEGDPSTLPPPPAPIADPGAAPVRWVFYTSGTTADPKGARHTDRHGAGRRRSRMIDRPRDHRRRPRRAGVPVHPHRRHHVWLFTSLHDRLRAASSSRPSCPTATIPCSTASRRHARPARARRSTWRTSPRSEQTDRQLFPDVRVFPGGGVAEAAAAPLRGEGGARRRRHRVGLRA